MIQSTPTDPRRLEDHLTRAASEHWSGALVLAIICGLLFLIANLPYQFVEKGSHWLGRAELPGMTGEEFSVMPTMAGFPFRYLIRSRFVDQTETDLPQADSFAAVQIHYWSLARLIANIAVGFLSSLVVFGFARFRVAKLRDPTSRDRSNHRRNRLLFDLSLAAVILIVPAILVGLAYRRTVEHREIAQRIIGRGNCTLSCWLPAVIADQVPAGLLPWLKRLRKVQCVGADDELVGRIVALPTIVQFESHGGTFRSQSLRPLLGHPCLTALALRRQEIHEDDLKMISQLRWITRLSLANTTLDNRHLPYLDSIENLRMLNLSMTSVQLSRLGKPKWASYIKTLHLSRPPMGTSDSLSIKGWPHLASLSLTRDTIRLNASPMGLVLEDLPRLESLHIDRIQMHDLRAKNLPRLMTITDDLSAIMFLTDQDIWVPGHCWLRELDLEDLPSLTKLACFGRDLEKLRLRKLPGLKELEIGSYLSSSFGGSVIQRSDPRLCQRWMDEIGRGDGPCTVLLSGLPTESIDLARFANNVKIRDLRFQESEVSFDQVKPLAKLQNLKRLDLGSCDIESDQLSWFLDAFPELETFKVNGAKLHNVELTDTTNLRHIETNTLTQVDQFRIVDQPLIKGSFRIEHAPRKLEIRNARSIRGFALTEPWPETAIVSGLRDLKWFAAGGRNVDDRLLDVLLACPDVDQLTLAYSSLSRASLIRLGELRKLTLLMVPGADVDDDITAKWSNLRSLWEINLDDTRVGIKTIAWLSGIESLRSLSLNRVRLDDAALESLAELRQLSALSLREVDYRNEHLMPLLVGDALEVLDLSDSRVDAELLEAASKSFSLKALILNGCEVDPDMIRSIFDTNPNLAIEMNWPPALDASDDATVGELAPDLAAADVAGESHDHDNIDMLELELRAEMARRMNHFRSRIRLFQSSMIQNQIMTPSPQLLTSLVRLSNKVPRPPARPPFEPPTDTKDGSPIDDPTEAKNGAERSEQGEIRLRAFTGFNNIDSARLDLERLRKQVLKRRSEGRTR